MAISLQTALRPSLHRNSYFSRPNQGCLPVEVRVLRLRNRQHLPGGFLVRCGVEEGDGDRSDEDAPELLFVREVKRRGMGMNTTASVLEGGEEEEEDSGSSKTSLVSTEIENSLSNQRERSMALNSEGIEGLVPRAKLLLSTGGTFFLGFGPLVLGTVALFCALCLLLGPRFIHDLSKTQVVPHSYIQPSILLGDERILP